MKPGDLMFLGNAACWTDVVFANNGDVSHMDGLVTPHPRDRCALVLCVLNDNNDPVTPALLVLIDDSRIAWTWAQPFTGARKL